MVTVGKAVDELNKRFMDSENSEVSVSGGGGDGSMTVAEDNIEQQMSSLFGETLDEFHEARGEAEVSDEQRRENRKREKKRKDDERAKEKAKEREDCLSYWRQLNMYGDRYTAPTPKHLVIADESARKFSREDVLRRTSWLGRALNINDRAKLPSMKTLTIGGVQCTAVHCEDSDLAKKLLTLKKLGPCNVSVKKDELKNSVVGVLRDEGNRLARTGEEGIQEILSAQGVTKVFACTKGRDKQPTNSYKLIFDRLFCPTGLDINGYWYPIREYIQPPMRCFWCNKYEPVVRSCRYKTKDPTCQRCGERGHQKETTDREGNVHVCQKAACCLHCKGPHEVGHKDCSIHKKWWLVQEKKATQKLSHHEAKERVFGTTVPNRSIAQTVSANSTATIENENRTEIERLHLRFDEVLQEIRGGRTDQTARGEDLQTAADQRTAEPTTAGETIQQQIKAAVDRQVNAAVAASNQQLKDEMDRKFSQLHQQVAALTHANETLQKDKSDLKAQLQATKTENAELKKELEALRVEGSNTASRKRQATELDTSKQDKVAKKPVHSTNKTSLNKNSSSSVAVKPFIMGKNSLSQSSQSKKTSTKVSESKFKHSSTQPPKGGAT